MAHLSSHVEAAAVGESVMTDGSQHISSQGARAISGYYDGLQPPMPPYSRASSTGSPMAFPKFKSPPSSTGRGAEHWLDPAYHSAHHIRSRPSFQRETSEHFQPGWYYKPSQSQSSGRKRNEYSFSTAAGKVGGRSAAPDSLIRDSYRTDTLTPLARPIGKYRKTGIAAMASAKGVSKYYGDFGGRRSDRPTRSGTRRPRNRSGVRFRSSPPPQAREMAFEVQKRPRPRDLEDDVSDEQSQTLELDEDTRAAIRMSLLASETPESRGTRRGLRELSPNVVTARGPDHRLRKKRRPSYWDGDLKEIQESPARRDENGKLFRGSVREGAQRKVLTSPPKDGIESVRSERVEIEVEADDTFDRMFRRGEEDADADGTMMQIEKDVMD
ncbi:uncharacterized protein AB675_6422 [Cyphellophora attinorum]|uniref:Uncharacterized protein n=1 Tax=Cyphellophora attinorum TaxID=1664694 RepID=A0A0N0NQA8_9EURO|nr:uncharacterized protein AB675_6422 [Phialophora attinorum]KPI43691.1 hypothetical protein AB675_6422 [Phialophora attinorum]